MNETFQLLISGVIELLLLLVLLMAPLVTNRLIRAFEAKTGLEIEAKHEQTLHSAVVTGIRKGARWAGVEPRQIETADQRRQVVQVALAHVQGDGAREAVEHFRAKGQLVGDRLREFVEAALPEPPPKPQGVPEAPTPEPRPTKPEV